MSLAFSQSATAKILGIAALALLLLIPLAQVEQLVSERNARANDAAIQIAQRWGAAQQVGGPVLTVPVRRTVMRDDRAITVEETGYLLPDRVSFHARLAPELRSYGMYSSVVYLTQLRVEGRFDEADFALLGTSDGTPQWERARLLVPINDVHGIRSASRLKIGTRDLAFAPSDGKVGELATIAAPLAWPPAGVVDGKLPFSFELSVAGSERLAMLPLARTTEAHVEGAWPDPGFDGAFLPAARQVDASGFSADWQVLDLNRSIAQHWRQSESSGLAMSVSDFGVSLTRPASPYQRNTRAGKYGMLFIAMVFAAFFLFEVLRGLRVHPVQYLLIGAALCTFYVMLLALSEQIGFAIAYAAAALASVMLIGIYASAILRQRRAGLGLGALIAFVYALLYGLVSSEDYALLMGATALLAAVAALMVLTRKVDWYAMGNRNEALPPR